MSTKTTTKVLSRTSEVRLIISDTIPLTTVTLVNAGYNRSITFNAAELAALKEMLANAENESRKTIVDPVEASTFAYDESFFDAPTDLTWKKLPDGCSYDVKTGEPIQNK